MRSRLLLASILLLLLIAGLPLLLKAGACNLAALRLVKRLSSVSAGPEYWYLNPEIALEAEPSALVGLEVCPASGILAGDRLRGLAELAGGQPEAAGEDFRAALERCPGDKLARFWLGQALYAQGQTPEAVREWAALRAGLLFVYVGQDLRELGKTKAASSWHQLGLQIAQDSPASEEVDQALGLAYHELGLLDRDRGESASARSNFENAVQRLPGRSDFRYDLSFSYAGEGRYAQAVEQLEAARALDPRSIIPLCALGEVYLNAGEIKLAESMYAACLAVGDEAVPNDRFWHGRAYFGLSSIQFRRNSYRECLESALQAVATTGGLDPAWEVVFAQNFQAILAADPERIESYLQIGEIYERANRPLEASRYYRQALERWPASQALLDRLSRYQPEE